jgi:hypothetical protein
MHETRSIRQNRILVCGPGLWVAGRDESVRCGIDGGGRACRNARSARCCAGSRDALVRVQAVGEGGVAAAGAPGADGGGQGAAGAGQHDQLLGPGDAGVEQVALEHHPRAGDQRDDHGGVPDMAIALIRAIIAAADKDRDEMTVLLIHGEPAAVIAPLRA